MQCGESGCQEYGGRRELSLSLRKVTLATTLTSGQYPFSRRCTRSSRVSLASGYAPWPLTSNGCHQNRKDFFRVSMGSKSTPSSYRRLLRRPSPAEETLLSPGLICPMRLVLYLTHTSLSCSGHSRCPSDSEAFSWTSTPTTLWSLLLERNPFPLLQQLEFDKVTP